MDNIINYKELPEVTFAVYGTLKASHNNNRLLREKDVEFLGEYKTPPKYTLLDGGFPITERGGETAILCELYKTTNPRVIDNVFGLEGCTGEQGHPNNWYDIDILPNGAVIFVMDKGLSGRSHVVESGIWE